MVRTISPERLAAMQDDGERFALVDTRGEESYGAWHVRDAVNLPFGSKETLDEERRRRLEELADGGPVVTICAKGISSGHFAEEIEAATDLEVLTVEGGMEGWSRVYDVAAVDAGGEAEVLQVQRRAKGCLGYVVGSAGEAAVVDPTRHTDRFCDVAAERGYDVVAVLDTHVHADHISGGRALADELGVPYYLGERAAERGVEYDYRPLGRNETLAVGDVDLKALFTPGHTTEMASYLVDGAAVLTGDTLFVDSVGRTELQFGDESAERGARLLHESLHATLLALPDDVAVCPGHVTVTAEGEFAAGAPGDPVAASVGDLRTGLDLLGLDADAFVERVVGDGAEKPANYEQVIEINRGREAVEDESEANDLETGPNNCAAG